MHKMRGEIAHAWSIAYGNAHPDPHFVFATLLGIERNQAKRLCFEYMYSPEGREVFAIKKVHEKEQEVVFVYNFFSDMLKNAGLEIAVPALQEIFNMMED